MKLESFSTPNISLSRANYNEALNRIIRDENLHAHWLEALSYLEYCGARKILNYGNRIQKDLEFLKHAQEEVRHAYYLKKQMEKLPPVDISNYYLKEASIRNYLRLLDIKILKLLKKELGCPTPKLYGLSYLLTTYAIEVRALTLYQIYDQLLKENASKVRVKSILEEEKQHLMDMENQMRESLPDPFLKDLVLEIENRLFERLFQKMTNVET